MGIAGFLSSTVGSLSYYRLIGMAGEQARLDIVPVADAFSCLVRALDR